MSSIELAIRDAYRSNLFHTLMNYVFGPPDDRYKQLQQAICLTDQLFLALSWVPAKPA